MQQIYVSGNLIHSLLKQFESYVIDLIDKEKIIEPRNIPDEN